MYDIKQVFLRISKFQDARVATINENVILIFCYILRYIFKNEQTKFINQKFFKCHNFLQLWYPFVILFLQPKSVYIFSENFYFFFLLYLISYKHKKKLC